jgi:methylated-DNA-[protein]-cysteine S-methyltransferase
MNPYAPMVPCHRVIMSDGGIGGYSAGVAAKRRRLKREGIDWL